MYAFSLLLVGVFVVLCMSFLFLCCIVISLFMSLRSIIVGYVGYILG